MAILPAMEATRFASLGGRNRRLHLCPEVNGQAWDSLCGRPGPWLWSINRPWALKQKVCKRCSKIERAA